MPEFKRIAAASDLTDGNMKQYELDGKQVLIARVDGSLYAIDAICNHAIGYLEDGELEGFEVFCPLHAGAFDIRTGAPTRQPVTEPLGCYRVKIEGDSILIRL